MSEERAIIAATEVTMIETTVAEQIERLHARGYGSKRIARELGLARNTVRRYLRGAPPGVQARPQARRLDPTQQARARELWGNTAEGNAVVVRDLLVQEGAAVSLRTVQRHLVPQREQERARQVATVRFETGPGEQMQVDFGQKGVSLGGVVLVVYLFVATLCFSRRLYVRASLSQRQDEWKQGLEGALGYFGGRPQVLVIDNAKALVLRHQGVVVQVHPAFAAYCQDRELRVYACQPYRARTKGKVESGVKYVKGNGLAGRSFASFGELEQHLAAWLVQTDQRVHGTTHRRPLELFLEAEAAALRPLQAPGLGVSPQWLVRRVSNDCFVQVDTVRYSVPHRLARSTVEVCATATEVIIRHQGQEVARHLRLREPHQIVYDGRHFEGLWRGAAQNEPLGPTAGSLAPHGRSLEDYQAIVLGG